MNTPTETPKRYQCRHIFTDGHRCGSPCLRSEDLCYYHHTTRRPAQNPRIRRGRRSTFHLPLPEDRSAIQHSIGQILQRIAANDIDPRRAGLLLYGLQIASLNLPKQQPTAKPEPETVEEITTDPQLGILAPPAEVGQATKRKSTIAQLLEKMLQDEAPAKDEAAAKEPTITEAPTDPAILPTLQAAEADPCTRNPNPRSPPEFRAVVKGGFGRTAVRSRLWRGEQWKHGATLSVRSLRTKRRAVWRVSSRRKSETLWVRNSSILSYRNLQSGTSL